MRRAGCVCLSVCLSFVDARRVWCVDADRTRTRTCVRVRARDSTARIERRERARDDAAVGGGGTLRRGVVRVIIGVEEDATTRRAVREAWV